MVNAYNEFNKVVEEKEKTFDVSLIDRTKNFDPDYEKNKVIYEKLMRNLSSLLNRKYNKMSMQDYCRFLYQWLYHSQKKYDIGDYYLGIFYGVSHDNIVRKGGTNICSYFSYATTYENPLNIIKLENFQEDIDIIQSILKNKNDSITSCKRYICECFKIYKKLYQQSHCQYESEVGTKRRSTCDKLRAFKTAYTSYLYDREIKDKVPSLDTAENEPLPMCNQSKPVPVIETAHHVGEKGELKSLPGVEAAPRQSGSSVSTDESENTKPFNTSTIVSTVAGIPPFLALIYKVNNFYIKLKRTLNTNICVRVLY
ncbi:hypothetical protein PVIIG_05406 [Plasmodium vivax India VII]|uniref:Variable surface protein Vir7-like protein n=1 Tax=Plasmodium vivax India VII TaxID=1077284 RepID=A0A0J9S282_PLAVI|nr:hypothetical protein PVIIG_05406 [Plasmodium vivax India VII]